MKRIQLFTKRDIIYKLLYLFFFSTILLFIYFNKKDNNSTNFIEIPQKDELSLQTDTIFANKKNSFSKNSITYIYQPIKSINQTIDDELNRNGKTYTFQLEELELKPKLVEARINRVKVSLQNKYTMQRDARLLTLKFNEIEFKEKKMHYQFAFNEFGNYEDFCHENTLNIHVPIGEYNLYIRAVDFKNNVVTKYTKIITFSRVPYPKGVLFWLLISIIVISPFVFYFFKFKFSKQKQQFQQELALEKQRSKITADLHDEIGSSLSSLQINSAVASFLIEKNPTEAQKILQKIESQSEHLSDKIGDIIWSMKPGKEEFLTLTSRIKNFANEIVGSTNINYKIDIDKNIDKKITDISTRKNIVLFVKEAINNAVKYSKAKQLTILIQVIENQISIEVSDDGVGFDTSSTNGNGLGNMQNRIEELKGQFSITSELNLGTKVKATMPIIP
ncbi:histidine kinase [Flavobacterium sp.]|uniref:sensor histidine kinase n=1 Tax=Flavobacterium sp. TaxID=239 RepID=UPI00333FE0A3